MITQPKTRYARSGHTGKVELVDDVVDIAVHTAARVGALAGAGDVLVSGTVKDLVAGSGIAFSERGEHVPRGCPMSGGSSQSIAEPMSWTLPPPRHAGSGGDILGIERANRRRRT